MERVIIYTRVSTDEQSLGYSLRDQKEKLEKYSTTKGYSIIAHYEDDHSAKTFDRPAFKKLLEFIKRNKGVINKLVFLRFDRFSRNITDALMMIRELSKYNVVCEAAEQPLDLTIPENKLLLTIYLASPEIENDRRSLNTISGTRKAMKEGRWCNAAPFGYRFTRDERNKPLLIPNGKKADLIKEAFELYATGSYTKEAVRRMLRPKGMLLQAARFAELFHNYLYVGKILIKEYKNEPQQFVKAVHEPLINEELFAKVQYIASGKRLLYSKPNTVSDQLPLRGFLQCSVCGNPLTGSASKSSNGTRYFYYHCQPPCKSRFRADEANSIFESWLNRISLKPEHTETYLKFFEVISKQEDGDRKLELQQLDSDINRVKDLLLKTDRLFIEEKIDLDSYQRLKDAYTNDIVSLEQKRKQLKEVDKDLIKQLEFAFNVMANLQKLWNDMDLEGKRLLISSIIPGKLIFENGQYRTTENNPILSELFNIDGDFKQITASEFRDRYASVAGSRIELPTSGL